jgi:hypothetical protein
VKPEEIAYLESQVKAVKARIGYLRNRSNQLTLIAPFTGRLQPSFSPDTLLYMTNCSDAIVHLPIALTDAGEFTEGKKVNLHCPESELSFSGTIITLGKEVTIIDMRQVIYVSILVEDCDAILLPGMVLRCSLNTKSVSLAQYFYLKMK